MTHRNDSLLSKKVISVWHWLSYLLLRAVTIYKIMKQILCHTEMNFSYSKESHSVWYWLKWKVGQTNTYLITESKRWTCVKYKNSLPWAVAFYKIIKRKFMPHRNYFQLFQSKPFCVVLAEMKGWPHKHIIPNSISTRPCYMTNTYFITEKKAERVVCNIKILQNY